MKREKFRGFLKKREIILMLICLLALLCGGPGGCTEESDDTQQTTTGPQHKFETAEELTALNVTLTQVGSPVWKPTGFSYFSAEIGNASNDFKDLMTVVQCYSSANQPGKNYFSDLNVYVPEREHPNDYFTFIKDSLAACSFTSKQVFKASEFKDPNAIIYVFQIVPVEGSAPVGKSPYKDQDLIIPNSKFPIVIDGALFKDDLELDTNFDSTLQPVSALKYRDNNEQIPGDGHPHVPLLFGDAYDFVKDKLPETDLPGVYQFRVELRDAEQAGWTVTMSYTLESD